MKSPPFLFISKDLGGADVAIPLARLARDKGHNVVVIAEDLAAREFQRAGFSLYYDGGIYDAQTQKREKRINPEAMLRDIKPSAVVATCGNPINLEGQLAKAANALGIPLVLLEDFWGGSCHVNANPQLILTLDAIGADIIRKHRGDVPTAIVGNHAVKDIASIRITDELQAKMEQLRSRFQHVLVFVGGGPEYTGPTIALLNTSLRQTTASWVLIPQFHPKWINNMSPAGRPYGEIWSERFADLGERIAPFDGENENIDALIACCDMLLAPFSTTLATAVSLGKRAVSISTPESRKDMRQQMTIERHPLVPTGLVSEISAPQDLAPLLAAAPQSQEAVRQYLEPFDPQTALAALAPLFDKSS